MIGNKVPFYGKEFNTHPTFKIVAQYYINRLQQLVGRNERLWFVIKYIKKKNI